MAVTEANEELTRSLAKIRGTQPVARNTAGGGALLAELFEVCRAWSDEQTLDDLKEKAEHSEILRKPAFETRKRVWRSLRNRYLETGCDWSVRVFRDSARAGAASAEFVSLAYLYFALRDRLTFDFVIKSIWLKWNQHQVNVDQGEFLGFLNGEAQQFSEIEKWTENTRKKLARNTLSALRDFGLLQGSRKKKIQRPAVASEIVFHLVCILLAEGLEGRSVIEAPDWRLFLWTVDDVSQSLGELAQLGWIRYERGGRMVILQLQRQPGDRA
ncbi:MAG: BrxA family protein [Isosphaeraceae bacterium]